MEKIHSKEERLAIERVPVYARDGTPLEPTDHRMARLLVRRKRARWSKEGGVMVLRMRKGNSSDRRPDQHSAGSNSNSPTDLVATSA